MCNLDVCNTILQANNITSLTNPNIDPVILQNCGNYIPTEVPMESSLLNLSNNSASSDSSSSSGITNTMIIITIVGIILIAIYFFIM